MDNRSSIDVDAIGDVRARLRIIKRFADVLNEQVDELESHVRRELPDHRLALTVAKTKFREAKSSLVDMDDRLIDTLDLISRKPPTDPS